MNEEGNVPVVFKGERYVWLKNSDGSGPLAYLHHLDEDGNVKFEHAFTSDSFAHISSSGDIHRYGSKIGTVDDLEFVQ